jgi:hypothetical protein
MAAPLYEERPCWRCDRGHVLRADHPLARPVWTRCRSCSGSGRVKVYVYPRRRVQ